MKTIILMAAALMLSACAKDPGASLSGNAESDGGMFAVATLAGAGSFEFKAAPFYTQLMIERHQAAVALRHHAISVDQAIAVQDGADAVRKLLDASLAACVQDAKTGQCTKNQAAAEILLDRAAVALDKVREGSRP